ncbi:MAG: hypothetical protein C0600_08030 [Ignavibacteria bacterium]|nr:MAG: hypothetical protein C0600_08030 [Ignavibacteria bacterium]
MRSVASLAQESGFAKGEGVLQDYVLITPSDGTAISELENAFASLPGVLSVTRERLFRLHAAPDDSAWSAQWGIQRIRITEAWEVTRGATDIVIGVIDTGIDFDHPDLRTQHWINTAEDHNGDGFFQPWPVAELRDGITGDLDGVDDDGNGFVDDVLGYDFVDQPQVSNAAGGDYFEQDAVPYDEMGHGSSVAGIVAAATDNGIGIAGVAPGCRIMTLRAFDARGIGAESDVARALAYAVANGVRVVNMSFGDVVYSRVLRDVIRYAYARGVVLVSSAGNSQSYELHYPSAYDETISVSATASNDVLAGFSNYGQTIDLAAPGSDILTTDTEGRYITFFGTSASTPFVSGVAALILTRHPEFSPEDVRGVLIASAEDLGKQGWDDRYGAGLLRADRAVALDNPSVIRITTPRTDFATDQQNIVVRGTAASPVMRGYRLQYGMGENPLRWNDLTDLVPRQAVAETLAVWDVSALADTTYTLRLAAESDKGVTLDDRVVVHIDRTPPRIVGVGLVPALEGTAYGIGVGFLTDEATLGRVWFRESSSSESWQWVSAEGETENNLFIGTSHHIYMGPKYFRPGRSYEFYISAENAVGLVTEAREPDGRNFEITIPSPVSTFGYNIKPYGLPLSRLHGQTYDINGNGTPELLCNDLTLDNDFRAWEYQGNGFSRVDAGGQGKEFPRGSGDLNGDGLPELLTSFVRNGFLYRGAAGAYPTERLWSDTIDGDFWSVDIADVDGDGQDEALAVVDDSTLGIFSFSGGSMIEESRIVNRSAVDQGPYNRFSSPRAAFGDFNANGRRDILIGDADGDFFISEYNGSSGFEIIWGTENDFTLGSEFVAAGDFDGDGRDEFALGFRTGNDDIIPFWYFGIFRLDAQNQLEALWGMQFHGITESAQYGSFTRIQNSITTGNIDDDPAIELVITTYPELYVVEFDASTADFEVTWNYPLINTDAAVIADFDWNGIPEIAVATPDSVLFFERDLPYTGPEPPRDVIVEYENAFTSRISWSSGSTTAAYHVYRGPDAASMTLFGSFAGSITLTDPSLEAGKNYLYAVSTVDSSKQPPESPKVFSRLLRPHERPVLDSIVHAQEGQLLLYSSQDMGTTIPSAQHFLLNGSTEPQSVALLDARTILLSFGSLADGDYGLQLTELRDGEGIPFGISSYGPFSVVNTVQNECYIERVEYRPPRTFDVWFNAPVEAVTAQNAAHYEFQPVGYAIAAQLDEADPRHVVVELAEGATIGALGKEYVLRVSGVRCTSGAIIGDGPGSTAGVILNRQTLEDVFVYPNPLRPSHQQHFVTFANLTPRADIRIYTLSGLFVAEVQEDDGNGGTEWDLTDKDGNPVPDGVYLFRASGTDASGNEVEAVMGKFAIIR